MTSRFDLQFLGRGLPFAGALDDLLRALDSDRAAVVQSPPGTGKTTLAPPAVAEFLASARPAGTAPTDTAPAGRVVVTQPRRVAARAASRRLADLTDTRVGELAGHTVRGDRRVGPDTIVEFVTPGVLVRRLLSDPGLAGTGAVVLDEVHERHLESDLALGMLRELRDLREDLVLVAMSATVDAARFAALLGAESVPAPIVDVASEPHPLEISYAPGPGSRFDARGVAREFCAHVASVAAGEVAATGADALVFVPGAREIDEVRRGLETRLGDDVEVLALHGGLDRREQDRVISGRPSGSARPRIVVSTDVAESSLTVPGVSLVVDSCLSREPRLDSRSGTSGLVTVSASRDSCTQRAGRAARLGPGVAIRCVGEDEYSRFPALRTPAIRSADLTSAALQLACWGTPRGEMLPLPEAPPEREIARAEAVLHGLGAVDAAGTVTPRGRRLAEIPADPRLARGLLEGASDVGRATAADVVAMLAGDQRAPDGDLVALLRELRSGRGAGSEVWKREAGRLADILNRAGTDDRGGNHATAHHDHIVGRVVALARPDLVARRTGAPEDGIRFLTVGGSGMTIPTSSPLAAHEWLAVSEVGLTAGRGAVVRAAAPIDREIAEFAAAGYLGEEVTSSLSGGRLTARSRRRLGAVPLSGTPVPASPDAARAGLGDLLATGGFDALEPGVDARGLHRRLALLHRELGAPWPDVSGGALAERIDEWLAPAHAQIADGAHVSSLEHHTLLRALLPWPEASRLDELAPPRLEVPSGSSYRLDYPADPDDGQVVLACKLQECFGWRSSPRIVDGRVPVTVHLLSPAGRPLAQSRDLEFFWREVYPGVRAEMRGRYPKHPWPEDPFVATATRRTNRRPVSRRGH